MTGRKNFSTVDKKVLAALFSENAEVLSIRAKDAPAIHRKRAVWTMITDKFNSSPGISTHRTTEQLSKAWENMLARAKRNAFQDAAKYFQNIQPVLLNNNTDNSPCYEECKLTEKVIVIEDSDSTESNVESAADQKVCQFFMGGRKRKARLDTATGHLPDTDDTVTMRRDEHRARMAKYQAEMDKLHWETLYWRAKYENECDKHIALNS